MAGNMIGIILALANAILVPKYSPNLEISTMDQEKPPEVMSTVEIVELYKNFNFSAHGISLKDFIRTAQAPDTIVLDLRDINNYRKGHVKGALHIGADVTIEKLRRLVPSHDTTILVYCTNTFKLTRKMALTHTVAPQIYGLGYRRVYYLEDTFGSYMEAARVIPWEGARIE